MLLNDAFQPLQFVYHTAIRLIQLVEVGMYGFSSLFSHQPKSSIVCTHPLDDVHFQYMHFNCPLCSRESKVKIGKEFFYSYTCNEFQRCKNKNKDLKYSSHTECCLFFFRYKILVLQDVTLRKYCKCLLIFLTKGISFSNQLW